MCAPRYSAATKTSLFRSRRFMSIIIPELLLNQMQAWFPSTFKVPLHVQGAFIISISFIILGWRLIWLWCLLHLH